MSRAQLLDDDDDHSLPSDSQVEDSESNDQSRETEEGESDIPEPSPYPRPQPGIIQTINQVRQDDQKKGLAVSRQLVRHAPILSVNFISRPDPQVVVGDSP